MDYVGSFLQSGNTWDLLRVNQLFTGWLTRSNFRKRGRVALVGWDCKIYAISVSETTMNVSKAEGFGFYEPEGMENRLRASCVSDAWIRIFWAMSSSVSISLLSQIRSSFVVCFINTCFQTICGILDQNHLSVIFIYSEFMKNSTRSHIQKESHWNCWFQGEKTHVSLYFKWNFQLCM